MSGMLERLARKLCELNGSNPDRLEPGDAPGMDGRMANGDPAHFMWRNYTDRARTLIEVLREPTAEMVAAAVAEHGKAPGDEWEIFEGTEWPGRLWRAMIVAAE